jgi:hypothetical protein
MARETAAEKAAREEQEAADAAVAAAAVDAEASVDVPEDAGRKVKVPAVVGDEIVFSRGADVVARFKVSDGVVTARNDHERTLLLTNVAGAELVD